MRWVAADEARHDAARGVESWGVVIAGSVLAGLVRLTLDVEHGHASFVADLSLRAHGRLVVADEAVPVPRPAAGLDIRADGLWASLYCETPFEHWTLGLEAFGLRVDPGAVPAAWDALLGERVPVGYDLEWELTGEPEAFADGNGYRQPGALVGELLVARDRVPVEATAEREHFWGLVTSPAPGG